MFENYSKKTNTVLNHFLDRPDEALYLRQVAKEVKISTSTAKAALDLLEKDQIVTKSKKANASFYRLNTESKTVAELKKTKNMDFITKSGIVERIEKQNPMTISITLFGSFAKGTNTEKSDIDLLIISAKKTDYSIIETGGFEISIHQFTPQEWKHKAKEDLPFYQEIITTGKPLKGTLPIL